MLHREPHKPWRARHQMVVRRLGAGSAATALLLVAGCAAFPTLSTSVRQPGAVDATLSDSAATPASGGQGPARTRDVLPIPAPGAGRTTRTPVTEAQIAALVPDAPIEAALTPQPIGEFVATVFGQLIGVPYSLAPEVARRSDLIAGGTGGQTTRRDLFRVAQIALRQYGLEVYVENGLVVIAESEAPTAAAGLVRGRATPTTGGASVVQIFPVQTIEVNVLQQLLQDVFPGVAQARVTSDQLSNSMIISGTARDVATVVRLIRQIDQPRFAGAQVVRVEPVYWGAEALAQALDQTLTAEGYAVSRQALARRSIVILPFPAANQILVFADDEQVLSRVQFWVDNLDRPAALGDRTSTFVYQVRNIDAQSIGQLAIGQSPAATSPQPPTGVPGTPPAAQPQTPTAATGAGPGGGGQFGSGRVIVDTVGNRILFTGTAADYAQLRTLLDTLDVPAPQVVVEVIIAEVTLNDSTDIGLEFFGTDVDGDETIRGGTEGGIGVQAGGLNINFTGPDLRARFNASASNSKVNVLSRPRLVARSGGQARFQVGTDVPIITSQAASNSQNNGSTDVLQSIQYRQTGVILEIEPVIYGDRVDITISQEISEVGDAVAGIDSPTILNRSLTTQMALNDGWTGVLGGLISNSYTKSNTGVPFLKDIPLVGSAFQSNSVSGTRTELLLLITPIIIRGDEDMRELAALYAEDMNVAFGIGRGWSYTLTPFNLGPVRGLGLNLPSGEPASERPPLFPRRSPQDAPEAGTDPS